MLITPTSFSQPLVEELQAIFSEEYGVSMPQDDAVRVAAWLAAYFDALSDEIGTKK